jgi:Family of unknown function (DUF6599)
MRQLRLVHVLEGVWLAGVLASVSCGQRNKVAAIALPESNSAPGWVKTGETRTFAAADLWQYIDGDADRFVKAGHRETLTSDYEYRQQIDAVADLFVMESAGAARRVFDAESSQGTAPANVGDAARQAKGSLVFIKANYYVRLVVYQDSPEAGEALRSLAKAVAKGL